MDALAEVLSEQGCAGRSKAVVWQGVWAILRSSTNVTSPSGSAFGFVYYLLFIHPNLGNLLESISAFKSRFGEDLIFVNMWTQRRTTAEGGRSLELAQFTPVSVCVYLCSALGSGRGIL